MDKGGEEEEEEEKEEMCMCVVMIHTLMRVCSTHVFDCVCNGCGYLKVGIGVCILLVSLCVCVWMVLEGPASSANVDA
jgi:hypothetical protein